jgi:hypothetical protein
MRHLALIAVLAACDGGEGVPDARPPDGPLPTGTFSLTWTLTDSTDGAPISCDDADALSVRVNAVPQAGGAGVVESFQCSSGMGTSRPIEIGTYSLAFELRGLQGAIATATGVNDVVITANGDTPTGARDFMVGGTGNLTLRVNTSQTTNCDPIGMMGSGIDEIALHVTKGGTCVPVDFLVGAEPYTTTCPMPTPRACFENTVDVVATGIDAGRYMISITGTVMGAACWTGGGEARVPIDGATATEMVALGYDAANPACPPLP